MTNIHQMLREPGWIMHNILCPAKVKILRPRSKSCCTAQRQVFHTVSIFFASKKLAKMRKMAEISAFLDLQAIVNNSGRPARRGPPPLPLRRAEKTNIPENAPPVPNSILAFSLRFGQQEADQEADNHDGAGDDARRLGDVHG